MMHLGSFQSSFVCPFFNGLLLLLLLLLLRRPALIFYSFITIHFSSRFPPPPNCFLEESWRARCCVNIEPVVPQPLGSTCWPRPWGMGWVRALLEPGIGFRNRPADITGPGPWGMVARKGCRTRSGSTGAWVKHRVGFGN